MCMFACMSAWQVSQTVTVLTVDTDGPDLLHVLVRGYQVYTSSLTLYVPHLLNAGAPIGAGLAGQARAYLVLLRLGPVAAAPKHTVSTCPSIPLRTFIWGLGLVQIYHQG